MATTRLAVTGATGMVGMHVTRRAVEAGYQVRALVRYGENATSLQGQDVELVHWDLLEPESFSSAIAGQHIIVHTAAMVGDWGPYSAYRAVNVDALEQLLRAVRREGTLRRWIQLSSLGVYPARDHFGTDESMPPNLHGFDSYTRTKAEADLLLDQFARQHQFPIVKLRPGFMYGEGDRTVLPRLVDLLRTGRMMMLGNGEKLLDNTYVGNLADAVMLAIETPGINGQTFNIRDERLVTRTEYVQTVAEYLGLPFPHRAPLWLAKAAVGPIKAGARLLHMKHAPILTHARLKFMALNLDFSITKAKRQLGYAPTVDFQEGIRIALDWLIHQEKAAM
jgi:nucleoside-diphosphate-sugar epimerase